MAELRPVDGRGRRRYARGSGQFNVSRPPDPIRVGAGGCPSGIHMVVMPVGIKFVKGEIRIFSSLEDMARKKNPDRLKTDSMKQSWN